jgi:carboxylesterase type B
MVYIHGGAFHMGSGSKSFYGPDFLLDQNVILVTLNYRLGVFGK